MKNYVYPIIISVTVTLIVLYIADRYWELIIGFFIWLGFTLDVGIGSLYWVGLSAVAILFNIAVGKMTGGLAERLP